MSKNIEDIRAKIMACMDGELGGEEREAVLRSIREEELWRTEAQEIETLKSELADLRVGPDAAAERNVIEAAGRGPRVRRHRAWKRPMALAAATLLGAILIGRMISTGPTLQSHTVLTYAEYVAEIKNEEPGLVSLTIERPY